MGENFVVITPNNDTRY